MNDIQHDPELWDGDIAGLYRETRTPEPPSDLDEKVLAAANHNKALRRARRVQYWMAPVGLVAVIVLAVGLVQLLQSTLPPASTPQEISQQKAEAAAELRALVGTAGRFEAPDAATAPAPVEPKPAPPSAPADAQARVPTAAAPPAVFDDAAAPKQAASAEAQRPPEVWLADIAKLRREGRTADAEVSLKAFRRQYPDYPLDENQPAGETPAVPRLPPGQ